MEMDPEIMDLWPWLGHVGKTDGICVGGGTGFPWVARKSWAVSLKLSVADFRNLIAAREASIWVHFSRSDCGVETTPEISDREPRLWPRKRADWVGGRLAAISRYPPEIAAAAHRLNGSAIWTIIPPRGASIFGTSVVSPTAAWS